MAAQGRLAQAVMRANWWWIDRWRQSNAYIDLGPAEQALYRNLCDECWLREGGVIPYESMARASGFPERWDELKGNLLKHLTEIPGQGWTSKTAQEVIAQSDRRREKQKRYRESVGNAGSNAPGNKPGSPSPSPSPSKTKAQTERMDGAAIRANPLVGDRPEREKECLALVRELADLTDKDPTEVLGEASAFKGKRKLNPAAMSDDRLLNTIADLRKTLEEEKWLHDES